MAKRRSYHHGDLKRALLEASLTLIGEAGAGAFTLREVARRAGVSHNAPYRHFRDREELLAAVAANGFNRLRKSMAKAAESGSVPSDRLRLSGRGYVEFALQHPQHFAVMFDLPHRFDSYPETRAASERAFGALAHYVEDCQAEGSLPAGDWQSLALLAWSMVHGIAKLALSGHLPFSKPAQVLQFTDMATDALRLGMANLSNSRGITCFNRPLKGKKRS